MSKEFQISDEERDMLRKLLTGAVWVTRVKGYEGQLLRDMWLKRWVSYGGRTEDNIWDLPDDLYKVLRENVRCYVLSPMGKVIARQLRLEPLALETED